jgi:alpha-L-fucosidase
VNTRAYDDVKLRAAAYYYNRSVEWGRESTLATKDTAYLFGSVQDFEKQQRAPRWIYPAAGWQCDDALGSTWGYTTGMTVRSPESVLRELIEIASQGGNLLLNISPMGDGSIPEVQQQALLAIGAWLKVNGEAIYGSHPWVRMGEGPLIPVEAPGNWKGGSTAEAGPKVARQKLPPPTEADFRFTAAQDSVYALGYQRPERQARLVSFAAGRAKIERVTMPGSTSPLDCRQTPKALLVALPEGQPSSVFPYVLRLEGSLPLGLPQSELFRQKNQVS